MSRTGASSLRKNARNVFHVRASYTDGGGTADPQVGNPLAARRLGHAVAQQPRHLAEEAARNVFGRGGQLLDRLLDRGELLGVGRA